MTKAAERLAAAIHLESAAIAPQTSPLIEAAKDALAEIERLRTTLGQYGTHMHDCRMQNFRDESDCTCGWRDVECGIVQQLARTEE